MGPIEAVFIAMFIIFGVVGVVRGYARELGVTTMLFIALFVCELVDERYVTLFYKLLGELGVAASSQNEVKIVIFCVFLILMAFITYQGETLAFPSKGKSNVYSLGAGLLNGYLFAGSLWAYLDKAGWPGLHVVQPFSNLYQIVIKVLPPTIFRWEYLIALAVFMLIMRVLK